MAAGILGKLVGVTDVAKGVADVIDKFVETPEEKKAAETLLLKIQQEPDRWQAEINKIEAAHRSIFVAGWRPFIGWVCGFALAWKFLGEPIFTWVVTLYHLPVTPPVINTGELISIIFALLGLGGIRSWEKARGLTK